MNSQIYKVPRDSVVYLDWHQIASWMLPSHQEAGQEDPSETRNRIRTSSGSVPVSVSWAQQALSQGLRVHESVGTQVLTARSFVMAKKWTCSSMSNELGKEETPAIRDSLLFSCFPCTRLPCKCPIPFESQHTDVQSSQSETLRDAFEPQCKPFLQIQTFLTSCTVQRH